MDVMDKGIYSDGGLGPFFNAFLDEFQEGEYKEGELK